MSKKNHQRQAEKRRAKKREKQKRKRPVRVAKREAESRVRGAALAERLKQVGAARKLLEDGVAVPDITDDEHIWWLCHGANFLASDMAEGVWAPLFEGIYEGQVPSLETIPATVMSRYSAEFEADEYMLGPAGAVLVWTVTDKTNIRIHKFEAERRIAVDLEEAGFEGDIKEEARRRARQPYNGTVWAVMAQFQNTVLTAQKMAAENGNEDASEEEAPDDPT